MSFESTSSVQDNSLPQPAFLEFKPSWYQTASKMRGCGVTLTTVGLLLAAATVGGVIVFSGYPLYNSTYAILIAVSGSTATLLPVVFGIYLLSKNYWKDPAFCQKKQDNIRQCLADEGYAATRKKYHSKTFTPDAPSPWDKHDLISREEIRTSVEEKEITGKKYDQFSHLIQDLIQDEIFEQTYFDMFLKEEITTSLQQDGYIQTKQTYSDKWTNIISREEIQTEVLAHFAEKTYLQIQADKKNDISTLYKDDILPRDHFKELLQEENIGLSFSGFLKQYGWQPFADGVVGAEDETASGSNSQYVDAVSPPQTFRQRFETEIADVTIFHVAFVRFSDFWKLFEYGIALGENFHDMAVAAFGEPESSFVNMIEGYSWKLFEKKIVSNRDEAVNQSFGKYLRDADFTSFIETYYEVAKTYQLIPEDFRAKAEEKKAEYAQANTAFDLASKQAEEAYTQAVAAALSLKEQRIELYSSSVARYENEQSSLGTSMFTVDLRIRAKERRLSSLRQEQSQPVPSLPNPPSLPQISSPIDHSQTIQTLSGAIAALQAEHVALSNSYWSVQRDLSTARSTLSSQENIAESQYQQTVRQAETQRNLQTGQAQQHLSLVKDNINLQWRQFVNTSRA